MKKNLIFLISGIILIGITTTLIYFTLNKKDINTNNNNNITEEEEKKEYKDYIVISNKTDKIYQLDNELNKTWEYTVENLTNITNNTRVYDKYIYYTDNNNLYRRNTKTNETEDLKITLTNYHYFYVEKDIVVYSTDENTYVVDINTKENTPLEIISLTNNALVNNNYYYTNSEDNTLNEYNIKTKESQIIENKAKIIEYNNKYILYINEEDNIIQYNAYTKEKKNIIKIPYAYQYTLNNPIHLYNDDVYIMRNQKITNITNSDQLIIEFEEEKKEKVMDFIKIDDNHYLLTKYKVSGDICQSQSCEENGEYIFILVNTKDNTNKEFKELANIFNYQYEVYQISK